MTKIVSQDHNNSLLQSLCLGLATKMKNEFTINEIEFFQQYIKRVLIGRKIWKNLISDSDRNGARKEAQLFNHQLRQPPNDTEWCHSLTYVDAYEVFAVFPHTQTNNATGIIPRI